MQTDSLVLLRAHLDLFLAVVAIPAVELAIEGGPVPRQCQMVPPLLLDELAAAPDQTRRIFWQSRLVRLAVARLMAAGLVRVLLDILLAVAAAIVGRAASIQTQTFSPCLPRRAMAMLDYPLRI